MQFNPEQSRRDIYQKNRRKKNRSDAFQKLFDDPIRFGCEILVIPCERMLFFLAEPRLRIDSLLTNLPLLGGDGESLRLSLLTVLLVLLNVAMGAGAACDSGVGLGPVLTDAASRGLVGDTNIDSLRRLSFCVVFRGSS